MNYIKTREEARKELKKCLQEYIAMAGSESKLSALLGKSQPYVAMIMKRESEKNMNQLFEQCYQLRKKGLLKKSK